MARKKPLRGAGDGQRFGSRGAARGGRSDAEHRRPGAERPARNPVSPNRRHGFADGRRPYDYAFYESEPATPEYMARLFARYAFPVTDGQLARFWRYYELLREHNASLDLTRIMGIEATVLKHFIDSAIVTRWVRFTGPVLDIGSGPGFPGLPLAVMHPELRFILAESRGKRVRFLQMAVAALNLANVAIFPKSVREDSPLGDEHGQPIGDVVTRALETITPTLARILPFAKPGLQAAFMKGPDCDAEIDEAKAAFAGVFTLTHDAAYDLPTTDQKRRLVVFQKDEYLR